MDRALPSGSVLADPDVLEAYSHDESEVKPQMPGAVVRARSTHDVSAVLKAAHAHGIPVTPRAGGTGRVGGAVPVENGIVLAVERMSAIKEIDRRELIAVVEPGVITGALHEGVEAESLFYPPDPNSWPSCALGGNIANNAGGPRAFKYGVTREYVLGLEIVMADGSVQRVGRRTRKGVTGYDLTALIVGSEGTLAVVTEATLKLLPLPEDVATMLVFLKSEEDIERAVTAAVGRRIVPRCIELMDGDTLSIVRAEASVAVPEGTNALLIVELDGESGGLDGHVERCGGAMLEAGAIDILVARPRADRERLWAARRELSRSLRKLARFKLAEDVVVPRTKIAALLMRTRAIGERFGLRTPAYGHAGDGNLHVNFLWDNPEQWSSVESAIAELLREVVAMGGTIAGEHGIGVMKAPFLSLEQSPEIIALQERIKATFDPQGILNPGKIFPAAARRFHGSC